QDTRLPLAQRRGPGQQVQALLAYHRAECAIALFRFDVPERLAAVHQCPHPPLLLGHQGFAAPIPFQRLFLMQQLRQVCRQPGGIQSRGQEDPRIALTGVPAETGNHQPLLLLQTVDLGEGGRSPVGQAIVAALLATPPGDAIRIGQRQQQSRPVLVLRARQGFDYREAGQQFLPLFDQTPCPLQGAAIQRRLVARCIESGQPAGNVGILDPAQQVPLAEAGRQPASQLSQAQSLAAQQHVRQARVHRQLTQSSAVFGQCPTAATALKSTQLNQQIPALLQGGGGRWVEPDQFGG